MKRFHAAMIIALAALALIVHSAAAGSGLKRAEELFRRKDYERAIQEISADTASLEGKSLDEALLMLAGLETKSERAERLYRRIVRSESERVALAATFELAGLSYASGDYRGALEILLPLEGRAASRDPVEIVYLRGLCRKQLGENTHARIEFEKVTRGEYAFWGTLACAEIDMQEGNLNGAIEKYEGLEKARTSPIASFKLGECYEAAGEKDQALAMYRALVERFPLSLEAGKGKEKIQLLGRPGAQANAEKSAGGGETGESHERNAATRVSAVRGFTVQFGSFSARSNALAVAGKIEKLLNGVRVESVTMDGRIWHRVRAGFYETREAAEKDAARAKERLGISGDVIPLT